MSCIELVFAKLLCTPLLYIGFCVVAAIFGVRLFRRRKIVIVIPNINTTSIPHTIRIIGSNEVLDSLIPDSATIAGLGSMENCGDGANESVLEVIGTEAVDDAVELEVLGTEAVDDAVELEVLTRGLSGALVGSDVTGDIVDDSVVVTSRLVGEYVVLGTGLNVGFSVGGEVGEKLELTGAALP